MTSSFFYYSFLHIYYFLLIANSGTFINQIDFIFGTHTHTQTCKHRQTGSSHCSSFVYTLTFSQHLSYVLYTFGKRGPFSNWGPYCSFCYKSPVWMPKHTHTHTHTHNRVNTGKRGPPIVPLLFITFSQHLSYVLYTFGKRGPFSNWGPYCSFCYKSPVWMPKQTHTHRVPSANLCRTLTSWWHYMSRDVTLKVYFLKAYIYRSTTLISLKLCMYIHRDVLYM